VPGAAAEKSALEAQFLKNYTILLFVHENGERQFGINDFLRKSDDK